MPLWAKYSWIADVGYDFDRKIKGIVLSNKLTQNAFLVSPLARALAALIIVGIIGIIFHADGAFLKWNTHRDMLRSVSVYGILSCGMTLVIITGGIDLAVGSILALTAVTFSLFCIHWGLSPWLALLFCVAIGLACGAASGLLVACYSIQPFIATLAMMVFARGLAKWVSGGQKISTAVQQADGSYMFVDVPSIYDTINAKVLGDNVSVVTVIFLVCLVICATILIKLRPGRYIYAVGGNEEAARLSGVSVARVIIFVYIVSAVMAGIGGCIQASQIKAGDPNVGKMDELYVIAAVVVGGTSLSGGSGKIFGTLIGAFIIAVIQNGMNLLGMQDARQMIVLGLVILGGVLLDRLRGASAWAFLAKGKA